MTNLSHDVVENQKQQLLEDIARLQAKKARLEDDIVTVQKEFELEREKLANYSLELARREERVAERERITLHREELSHNSSLLNL